MKVFRDFIQSNLDKSYMATHTDHEHTRQNTTVRITFHQHNKETLPQEVRAYDTQQGNCPRSVDTWLSLALAAKDMDSLKGHGDELSTSILTMSLSKGPILCYFKRLYICEALEHGCCLSNTTCVFAHMCTRRTTIVQSQV